MRLTRFTDYSLRVLMYIGLRTDGRVTIKEIAKTYDLSRNHLMKVVSHLVHKGYLDARRGPGGGIELARPANEINLAEVIQELEEDMNLVECFCADSQCVIQPACRLRDALAEALKAYLRTLGKYSLQDLLEPREELNRLLNIQP